MKVRDIDILRHIERYCADIENTVNRFGKDQAHFDNDVDYRNSVCMSLLQVGELAGHLSEAFRESTKEAVYWPGGTYFHMIMEQLITVKYGIQ